MFKKIFILLFFLGSIGNICAGDTFRHEFNEGIGRTPTAGFSFFNFSKWFSYFFGQGRTIRRIRDLLYKEYISGLKDRNVNKLFFDLDEKTAMHIGPKISEFRQQPNRRYKTLQEISDCAGFENRFW